MCNFKRLLLESTYAKIQDLSRSISRTSYYVTRRPIFLYSGDKFARCFVDIADASQQCTKQPNTKLY